MVKRKNSDWNYKIIRINGKAMPEHRHIMENHLGRKLLPEEIVHHKDRNRQNNEISNLKVTTHSDHAKEHQKNKEIHSLSEDYNWYLRYKKGKRVLVKDKYGNELFISFSISCAAKDTGIPVTSLWLILTKGRTQREEYKVSFF